MIIDPLFALFCQNFTTMTPGTPPGACQTAINAASTQTSTTGTLNQLQTYGEARVYKIVDKDLIYGSAGLIYLINSWNTKTLMFTFPLSHFEFNGNIANNSESLGIKYKYEF